MPRQVSMPTPLYLSMRYPPAAVANPDVLKRVEIWGQTPVIPLARGPTDHTWTYGQYERLLGWAIPRRVRHRDTQDTIFSWDD